MLYTDDANMLDLLWEIFHAIDKTIESAGIHLLDQATFSDFVSFCRKFTSTPPQSRQAASAVCEGDDERFI